MAGSQRIKQWSLVYPSCQPPTECFKIAIGFRNQSEINRKRLSLFTLKDEPSLVRHAWTDEAPQRRSKSPSQPYHSSPVDFDSTEPGRMRTFTDISRKTQSAKTKAFSGGRHLFALLQAIFAKSSPKHCGASQLAKGRSRTANVTPRTNRKCWDDSTWQTESTRLKSKGFWKRTIRIRYLCTSEVDKKKIRSKNKMDGFSWVDWIITVERAVKRKCGWTESYW